MNLKLKLKLKLKTKQNKTKMKTAKNKTKTKMRTKTAKNKTKSERVFKKQHYNSGDGMLTTVWGPPTWHSLHTISFNYPVHPTCQDKTNYRNHILNLRFVLPCGKCRLNLCKNFKKLPLTMKHMESRETFSKYVYDLHEVINKMLGKKSALSYNDVRERYEHFRARCNTIIDIKNKENGCTEPIYGEKSKCVLHIVPQKKSM